MDNYKKQILQRVIDFYIEKADADKKTIKTVACLMNDLEAINYTRCCTELCECAVDCVETEYNKDFVLVCKKCQKPLIA
jgi:hypothetical protein